MHIFQEEVVIPGSSGLPITLDVTFNPNLRNMPVVLFCHGFKGFKDWGPWNLVASNFAEHGVFFVKMNFSHNGVSVDDLTDITDAQAFGKNTLSQELRDLELVIDWLSGDNEIYRHYMDQDDLTLIGHSRGAATCMIATLENERISRLVSWAGAFNLRKFAELLNDETWKHQGYVEVINGRNGQTYQIDYGFRKDFLDHEERFDLTKRLATFDQNFLMIHGTTDDVAPISNARKIHQFISHTLLIEIESGHTFDGNHPWTENELPIAMHQAVQDSLEFILS